MAGSSKEWKLSPLKNFKVARKLQIKQKLPRHALALLKPGHFITQPQQQWHHAEMVYCSIIDFFVAGSADAVASPSSEASSSLQKAMASGSWNDMQNMRLLGATSRTRWISISSPIGPPRYPSALLWMSAIRLSTDTHVHRSSG